MAKFDQCRDCYETKEKFEFPTAQRICYDCLKIRSNKRYEKVSTGAIIPGLTANQRLVKLYGITADQRNRQIEMQDGKCLLCEAGLTVKGGARPHIDHCHKTGKVRGVLCNACNTRLGHFEAVDWSWLDKAKTYVESCGNWQAGTVESDGIERIKRASNG